MEHRKIRYDEERKDLPSRQLMRLFQAVGWSDGSEDAHQREHFNAPFLHAALVVSAWDGESLVGVVRVLSDTVVRSVVYDLAVDPAYQKQGIGRELLRRCVERFPNTEWLVQTTEDVADFYRKSGFQPSGGVFLRIPSPYFGDE